MINDKVAEKVKNGAVLPIPEHLENSNGPIIAETEEGMALAIYQNIQISQGLLNQLKYCEMIKNKKVTVIEKVSFIWK